MANDSNERLIDAFQSTEDEDGQLCFSQYFFKEWTEIEALYKLTMYNENLNKKEESAAETSESEDDSEMEKESEDEEDEDVEEELEEDLDKDQDKINQLGENLGNMQIITKQNLLYENPMREQNRYQRYFFYNSRVQAAEGWIGKPENMDDDTFDSSSDDETSSLSD